MYPFLCVPVLICTRSYVCPFLYVPVHICTRSSTITTYMYPFLYVPVRVTRVDPLGFRGPYMYPVTWIDPLGFRGPYMFPVTWVDPLGFRGPYMYPVTWVDPLGFRGPCAHSLVFCLVFVCSLFLWQLIYLSFDFIQLLFSTLVSSIICLVYTCMYIYYVGLSWPWNNNRLISAMNLSEWCQLVWLV